MKKFKVISGWILVIAYLVFSLSFITDKREGMPCHFVKINILDSLENGFITQTDIQNIITKKEGKILGIPLSSINTKNLEAEILKNRVIKHCEVYKTANGSLVIDIIQRQPVLRIINQKNQSYYLSEEGYIIPFSSIQTPNVLVATGYIHENYSFNPGKHDHVDQFTIRGKKNILTDLQSLGAYIYHDPFWKSQFVQLYVDKKGEIELIPRVGAHIIILGNAEGYKSKLRKLKTLYVKGLNNVGWNEYENINLKYKNQVICSKR